MRIYTIINLEEKDKDKKVNIFNNFDQAYIYFENKIKEFESDEDKITAYIDEGNYKDKIFFITKDINPGYFQDDDFLKFVNLMNNLGLDMQTAMRLFIKQCLRTSSIPFEIKC